MPRARERTGLSAPSARTKTSPVNGPRLVSATVTLSPSALSPPTVAPVTIEPPRLTILSARARVNLAQSPVSSVPGHGVVAGGDRNAGETLKIDGGFGHPQAGAGDEDRFDPRRRGKALDRRFDRGDGDARGVAVVTTVESGDGGDGDAAGAERGDERSVD